MDTNTNFLFDGQNIVISSDLRRVFSFLQEIEKEVENFLGFGNRLELIQKQYLETINLIQVLANKLKENSIDFKFTFSEHPASIADKLNLELPVRSSMIILFSYLETLLALNYSYDHKTSDENEIRKQTMKPEVVQSFYENFCLSQDNDWVKKNPERLKRITADDLRKLRNSLTHFFSVNKIQVVNAISEEKLQKLEQIPNLQAKFISPEDLYEIIKGSMKLMMEKWSKECKDCLISSSNEFKEKILSVKSIVESLGAITVRDEQINL